MIIDKEKCIGCKKCIPYCPVDAIKFTDRKSTIDFDECVECGCCKRSRVCPTEAFYQQELTWPRSIRSIMSDVFTLCEETGVSGRGTEEMKTNDVTGRFKKGEAGFAIEVGRPIKGARFYEVEKIAMAIAKLGCVEYERANPITGLMKNPKTGEFIDDVKNEKVYSAILEFCVPLEKVKDVMDVVSSISRNIDTVFSLDICTRVDENNELPTEKIIKNLGYSISINGKNNVGLGRPLYEEQN